MSKAKQILLILAMIITLISSVLIDNMIKNSIINTFNKQAKLELGHIKTCFISSTGSILDRLNKCASNSLIGGRTGDVFVVNLKTMQVVWDNSVDCKIGEKPSLTKDSICKIAKNPNSCLKLAKQIKKGYNGSYTWNFDGSPEYDNWIILPDEIHNFDKSVRAIVGIRDQLALVQGFQYDEIMKDFNFTLKLHKLFTGILLFILIICYFIIKRNEE